MRLHVINLRTRADRYEQFLRWNTRPGLDLVRVEAAVGANMDPVEAMRDGLVAPNTQLTPGALGAAQSHRALWRQVVETGETILICEDDACLRGDFVEHTTQLLSNLGSDRDLLYLGYNTDALVAWETPDGHKLLVQFDDSIKRGPGYFDAYRALRASAPALFACYQVWGLLCYAVTPRGAQRLLDACFPISADREIVMFGQNRKVRPYGIDGMVNAALQRSPIAAFCAAPALAVSLNDAADSNTVRRAP